MAPERLQHVPAGAQITANLLQRDDVEARHDLGDAGDIEQVPLRRIAGSARPRARKAAEGAQVPCCNQEVPVELLRRDDRRELRGELLEPSRSLRRRIGDLRFLGHPATRRSLWISLRRSRSETSCWRCFVDSLVTMFVSATGGWFGVPGRRSRCVSEVAHPHALSRSPSAPASLVGTRFRTRA